MSSQGTEGPCRRFSWVYLRHNSCSSVVHMGYASTFLPEYGFKPHLVPCRDHQDGEGALHTSFSPDSSHLSPPGLFSSWTMASSSWCGVGARPR